MKAILLAAALIASPALAQTNANFGGVHADISAGFNDIQHARDHNDVNYGAAVGFDVPVGDRFTLGAEATADNVFQKARNYGASARIGYAVTPRWLAYGKVGYADYHTIRNVDLDGLRYGGGVQVMMSRNTYLKGEFRRTNYEGRTNENGALGGIGIRF